MSQPLVSLFVFCYKQEKFIREAVAGAFAQTYSPLEIIFSDDNSPDRTFEVIQELASEYRGPHRVILNRNPRNLFIPQHVNRIMELAKGELIVAGAGDDISFPSRVQEIVDAWTKEGRRRVLLTSGYEIIDEQGGLLTKKSAGPGPFDPASLARCIQASFKICGATHAWHRDVFHSFGPFRARRPSEDSFLFLRACLLDGVVNCDKPLLQYRIRGKAPSLTTLRRDVLYQRRGWPHVYRQWKRDLSSPVGANARDRAEIRKAVLEIEHLRRRNAVRYLAERGERPPHPPWRAVAMTLKGRCDIKEMGRLLLQRLFPWLWRFRRRRLSVSR